MDENEQDKKINISDRRGADELQKDKLDEFFKRQEAQSEAERITEGKEKRLLVVPGESQHKLFSWVGIGSFIAGVTIGIIVVFILTQM